MKTGQTILSRARARAIAVSLITSAWLVVGIGTTDGRLPYAAAPYEPGGFSPVLIQPTTDGLQQPGGTEVARGATTRVPEAAWDRSRRVARHIEAHASIPTASAPAKPVVKLVAKPPQTGGWQAVMTSSYGNGDGFDGGHMACGGRLDRTTLTVAYRYLHTSRAALRCGDRIQMRCTPRRAGCGGPKNSEWITVEVTDAGPFVGGRIFDLGPAACRALRACGIPTIEWRRAP